MNEPGFISKITLIQRLIIMGIGIIGLQTLLGFVAIVDMNKIGDEVQWVAERDIPLTKTISKITEHQLQQELKFEIAYRHAEQIGNVDGAEALFKKNVKAFDDIGHKIDKEIHQAEESLKGFIKDSHSTAEKEEFQHLLSFLESIYKQHSEWTQHADEVFKLLQRGKYHDAETLALQVEKEALQLEHKVTEALEEIEVFTEKALLATVEQEHALVRIIFGVLIVSIVVVIFIVTSLTKQVARAMSILSNQIEHVGNGDLIRVEEAETFGEFEILKQRLINMQAQLCTTVESINHSADIVASTSTQVASNSQLAIDGIESQAHAYEHIARSMGEVRLAAEEVAKTTANSQIETVNTAEQMKMTQTLMRHTGSSIQKLVDSINVSSAAVSELAQNSEQVGTVLNVIKGIAEQTNLLALNAAIEAARAGEQGRGFAVVADEVRTLAQRTQESTSEIEEMIDQFHAGSKRAVGTMTESSNLGKEGIELAQKSIDMVETISESIHQISDMSTQIASAAEEQTSVVGEINRGTDDINLASSNSLQVATETGEAATNLSQVALQLQETVHRFKTH